MWWPKIQIINSGLCHICFHGFLYVLVGNTTVGKRSEEQGFWWFFCIPCYKAPSYSSEELGLGEAIVPARQSFRGTLGQGRRTLAGRSAVWGWGGRRLAVTSASSRRVNGQPQRWDVAQRPEEVGSWLACTSSCLGTGSAAAAAARA